VGIVERKRLRERSDCGYDVVMRAFVRCPACGQSHVLISADDARAHVRQFNACSERGGWRQVAVYEHYLRCSQCAADSAAMLPAIQSEFEFRQTVKRVVVER